MKQSANKSYRSLFLKATNLLRRRRKNFDTLLVFNTAYNFKQIRDNRLEKFIESRDASNFFEKVISINPVSDLQDNSSQRTSWQNRSFFNSYQLNSKHLIIEGNSGSNFRFRALSIFTFFLSQSALLVLCIFKLSQHRIRLVRAEDPRLNGLYGLIASRLLKVPLIIGMWGNSSRIRAETKRPLMPRLFKSTKIEHYFESFVLRRADYVLAQNLENLSCAIQMGVDVARTALTPLGIGISDIHLRPREIRDERVFQDFPSSDVLTLITVSRLETLKYVDHSIRASAFLKKNSLKFRLIIVGEGRDLKYLENLCEELNVEDSVFFVGNRDQIWIANALRFSDIFLSPLCGRALLEAGLAGCPVVAYDVDWHDELVETGETGILVEHLNWTEFGLSLLNLASSPDTRKKMSAQIEFKANQMCKTTDIGEMQRSVYRQLLTYEYP